MAEIIEIENGLLIKSDDDGFIDVITRLSNIKKVKTPEDLIDWHNEIQDLIRELAIDGFKKLVDDGQYARQNRFNEALIILQGGL